MIALLRGILLVRIRVALSVGVAALILSAPADATAFTRLAFRGPSSARATSLVTFSGRVRSGQKGIRVTLQVRKGRGWRAIVHGLTGSRGRFVLTWIAPSTPQTLVVRAVVVKPRHPEASRARTLRVRPVPRGTPAAVISPKVQVLSPSVISSVPTPGRSGTVRYAGGNVVNIGQIIAVGRGPATPHGFLGRVSKVAIADGSIIVSTRPATLLEAAPSGSLDATLNSVSATAARRARAAVARAAAAAVTCKGSVNATIKSTLSFSAGITLKGSWKLIGGLQSASLAADAGANASISATATAGGSCKLKPTTIVSFPGPSLDTFVGPIPVVITSDVTVDLDASASTHASVTTGVHAGFSASAGIGWTKKRGFSPIQTFNPRFSYTPPTLSANATVEADLTPTVSVDLYGVAGPQMALKSGLAFHADISKNPWWTLDAPVDLTASMDIPPLKLSSPTLDLYRHTFPIANAGGPFGVNPGCGASCPPGGSVSVTNPGDQATLVGSAVTLPMQASDTDGGALGYSATGLPAGVSINPVSGLISGVPTTTGADTVTVTARDATGPTGSVAFDWTISASTSGACEPSSSLSVMVNGTNVVSYVPHGNWGSSTTDVSLVNVEGTSVTPTRISTPNVVNSAASNPFTRETVATANNTDVYLLNGTSLVSTLTSGGSGAIGFSGGTTTDAGVAMDAPHNRAVITLSVGGSPGFQFLDLNSNAFSPPIASPSGAVSEDPLIDPVRNLLLSASEQGNFEIANFSNPASPAFYENATGLAELDSSGEDCSTGIVLAPSEGSDPSEIYIADLTQATFTSGSPAGAWSAPSQTQTLSESSLSAGASALVIAQGTHTGVVAGEFQGNEITAFSLPATSGSGTPAITDWVTCGIDNTPDANPWSEGLDPHTVTAYQTPSNGDAVGLFANDSADWLARVDLTQLLNSAIVPRDGAGHACATGTIPSSVESFIAVP